MKIVHLCLCGAYNDGWNYQENCISYYHKRMGNDVTIITTPFLSSTKSTDYEYFKTGEYYDENGIKIIRKELKFSKKSRLSMRFRLYIGLYDSLVDEKPDIIFVHGLQFLDIRFVVKYLKKNPNVRLYVDGHEDFRNSATNWISKHILHKIIWKYCAQLVAPYVIKFWGVTPARSDFLIEMYKLPREKVDLLVMGADDEKVKKISEGKSREIIRLKYDVNENDFLIITGGKIDQKKPQTLLLMEAVKNINNKNVKLLVFGSVVPELKEKFDSLICESVIYVGWADSYQTYEYFNAGDLVVFPGLHSVFWEQVVGLGKPSIFKYIEGFTHVDLGGNCKFLYEDSINEISKLINEIINDNEVYQQMNYIARSRGIEAFSYKKIAQKSIEI
jgi:1,2-diacylglycerol 3-alpha-glucosyltransferase